jgi:hypothetical protein
MAQYIIGTSFCAIKWEEFILNPDVVPDIIITRVFEKKLYSEFRGIIGNYKSRPPNDPS